MNIGVYFPLSRGGTYYRDSRLWLKGDKSIWLMDILNRLPIVGTRIHNFFSTTCLQWIYFYFRRQIVPLFIIDSYSKSNTSILIAFINFTINSIHTSSVILEQRSFSYDSISHLTTRSQNYLMNVWGANRHRHRPLSSGQFRKSEWNNKLVIGIKQHVYL